MTTVKVTSGKKVEFIVITISFSGCHQREHHSYRNLEGRARHSSSTEEGSSRGDVDANTFPNSIGVRGAATAALRVEQKPSHKV